MQCIVIRAHRSNYPNPITFASGEVVRVGRRDDEYPGWIWTTTADGNAGWAPESLLAIEPDGTAQATGRYTARELDTNVGDVLDVLRELNGWYWVCNASGNEGWVPVETVRDVGL